jgi:hypothetical protein
LKSKNKKQKKKSNLFLSITIIIVLTILILLFGSLIFRIINSDKLNTSETEQKRAESESSIQISILNATDVNGLAGKFRDFLRNRNIDVVEIGNYDTLVQKSFIIDRVGDTTSSKHFARIIGLPDSMIVVNIDSSFFLKASLIIGSDYKKLKMFENLH